MTDIVLPMSAMAPAASLQFPEYIVAGDVAYYGLDDTTDEGGLWRIGKLPALAGSMTITFDVFATATTGTVAMACQCLAYTAGTDTTAITSEAFSTAVVGTATSVSGTTLVPVQMTVTLTTGAQQDNAATGDYFILKVFRDISADSLSGDAFISNVTLSFAAA